MALTTEFAKKRHLILLLAAFTWLAACSGQTGRRAAQGAAAGAVSGAAGSLVSALIFGGDVGDAAARGAAWGATSGAVSGAIAGGREDSAAKKKQQDEAARKLESKFGKDAFAGLTALARCKHPVALGYAETAQKQKNKNYRLAGLWLEVITLADRGSEKEARALLPEVVAADPEVASVSKAEKKLTRAKKGLENIRREHNLPARCKP